MSRAHDPLHERIEELVIDQVFHGVEVDASQELRQLNPREAREMAEEFEAIAATAHLAFAAERPKAMPHELRERLLASVPRRGAARREPEAWPAPGASSPPPSPRDAVPLRDLDDAPPTRAGGLFATLGWAVAAAAVLALAFSASLFGPARDAGTARIAVNYNTNDALPSVAALRQNLLDAASDAVVVPWSATDHPALASISGDVVWSQSRQEGYLRLLGVPANSTTERQYQLWIIDPLRDPKHPIDGGVFDVPAGGGEALIPIDPKLRVEGATVFAITLEQAGGVVVSEGPLLAVAKL